MDIYIIMMMIELDHEFEPMNYKDIEKEFDLKGLELVGIKYVNDEPYYLVRFRKIK